MSEHKIAVLQGQGINCDRETLYALDLAARRLGCEDAIQTEFLHLGRLFSASGIIGEFKMIVFPGGFLHGDDIAAGRILAAELKTKLGEEIDEYVSEGRLMLGICNGFQVLTKYPLLTEKPDFTLTWNKRGTYVDRWVYVSVDPQSPCVFLRGLSRLYLPVRHAEGNFVTDESTLAHLEQWGKIALRYVQKNGERAGGKYPANPNGSMADVAGVCDSSGRVFGLMPHPEAFVRSYQRPDWGLVRRSEGGSDSVGQGLKIFENAIEFIVEEL